MIKHSGAKRPVLFWGGAPRRKKVTDVQFNAPSNFKNGRLIANRFRVIDLIIAITGVTVSILLLNRLLRATSQAKIGWILLMLLPGVAAMILVSPAGRYHNILTFIQVFLTFATDKKKYIWEGVHKENRNE